MAMTSVSRSAFSRTGTVLTMKPGVTTLSVGTIDVTGIIIDENYSIDTSSGSLQFTDTNGTRNFSFTEDIISGGLIKPELMPDRALTQVYKPEDETALLDLDPIQIGDVAINQATDISYVALNGDNVDIADWEPIALASTHDAVNVTSTLRATWTAGYTHSTIVIGNPHALDSGDVGAISLAGTSALAGNIVPTGATSTYDLGSTTKYFQTLYASGIQLSENSSISANYNWDGIGLFLTGSPANSTEYSVYIKSEIDDMLGGGSAVDSMNLLKSTGSFLKIGRNDSAVTSADNLGSIHFTSTDANVIQDDPLESHFQLENTHAKILAKTTGIIYNTVDGLEGGELNEAGTWQRDANIEFLTGFNSLNTNFRVNSDNTIALPLYDWSDSESWSNEPISETNFLKIFANDTDKSLYYSTGTTNATPVRKQIVVNSVTADINALSVNFNVINSVEIDTEVLKIDGKVIDLDNIITSFDTWSQNTNSIEVNGTELNQNFSLEDITVNQITADTLIPSDAILLNITVLFRWRLTSNSHETISNTIQTGLVQIKRSDQGESDWKIVRSFTTSPGSYYTPENTSTAGDMIVVDSTYVASDLMTETTGIRDLLVNNSNVIFNMRIKDITSEQEKLILRDLSWGIRLYWR